jgi:putative phosphoribosyl transferase
MRRFHTLAAAGQELAASLTRLQDANDTIVLAIVRGGLEVAAPVARQLHLPLDLLFIRRLLAPTGPQSALCAVNVGGRLVLDEGIPFASEEGTPSPSNDSQTGIEYAVAAGLEQLRERVRAGRGNQSPVELAGKTVVLVDNGIHTGSTIHAAIRALRKLEVDRIVVAVPVADTTSRVALERAADEIICLEWPEKFGHVGLWYEKFVGRGDNEWVNGRLKRSSQET